MNPRRDRASGITRCAVCDGYMRRVESSRFTCAAVDCPGHATGGVLTAELAEAERAAVEARP